MVVAQRGMTALHWGAEKNTLRVIKLLLAAGAAVDVTDNVRVAKKLSMLHADCGVVQFERTALHTAAATNSLAVAKHLLDAGAVPDTKDQVSMSYTQLDAPLIVRRCGNSSGTLHYNLHKGQVGLIIWWYCFKLWTNCTLRQHLQPFH